MSYESYSYPMLLHVLTPVVINTGEAYEPFSICPGQDEHGVIIRVSELGEFLSSSRYSRLSEIACLNSLNPNYGSNTYLFREAKEIISEALKNAENQGMKDRINIGKCRILLEARNALIGNPCRIVSRHATNPMDEQPYIPGSSIKGAIRTAILEKLRKEKKPDDLFNKNRMLEAKLLYDEMAHRLEPQKDPLKYLKISDFVFSDPDNCSRIGKVNASGEIPVYTGMTDAMSFEGKDVIAKGTISIIKQNFTPDWLSMDFILEAIDDFYRQMSDNRLKKNGGKLPVPEKVLNILRADIPQSGMLRLGHYIGIENVTMNVKNPNPRLDNENGSRRFVTIESGVASGYCLLEVDKQ